MSENSLEQNLCIFAGSHLGRRASYTKAGRALVQAIAKKGLGIVYGGGNIGLMQVVAEEGLCLGIPVIGVTTEFLVEREVAHLGLTELHVVNDMLERKALMAKRACAYVGLPGGIGTFDEIIEMLTWNQLRLQSKRCGLLNVDGYFDPFLTLIQTAVQEKFLESKTTLALEIASDPEWLIDQVLINFP